VHTASAFRGFIAGFERVAEWGKRLLELPEYRMVWHSLCRDYYFQNVSNEELAHYLNKFNEYLKPGVDKNPERAHGQFVQFCTLEQPFLQGNPITMANPDDEIHHYVTKQTFRRHILRKGDGRRAPLAVVVIDTEPLIELLNTGRLTSSLLSSQKRTIGGRHGFFWSTTGSAVKDKLQNCSEEEVPSCLRNALALSDFSNDVMVQIPITASALLKLRIPTILDANGSPYFRPAKRPDGWGETFDLATLGEGLPEAIHPEIEWDSEAPNPSVIGALPEHRKVLPDEDWNELLNKSQEAVNFQC